MSDVDIFKTFDIRGRFPEEINEDNTKKIAYAYFTIFKPAVVVIGHDATKGAINVQVPFIETLANLGVKVYVCGLITSPVLYFASNYLEIKHSVMITASHLGIKYTGFKFLINSLPPSELEIKKTKKLYDAVLSIPLVTKPEHIVPVNVLQFYEDKILKLIADTNNLNRYSIVFDAGNSAIGPILEGILPNLNVNYKLINQNVEYINPRHETNPKIAENRNDLIHEVFKTNSDLGIIFDGDADRAYFIDSDGEVLPPEFIAIYIYKYLHSIDKLCKMTIDVRASSCVEKEIAKFGGRLERIPAWHVTIKNAMDKDPEIIFGMETSGHYVFRDFYKIDDGLLASILFVKAISRETKSLKSLVKEFRQNYYILEEINFNTSKDYSLIINKVKEQYKNSDIDLIDGISVNNIDYRFNIRASKTEPLIRLNISGTNKNVVDRSLKVLETIIR